MLAGGGARTAASFREIPFNPHRRPHICGGCPACCAARAPRQDSGHPGRSPRGEREHGGGVRWGGGEAGGLPLGWGKGMRKREEKQQIHLPFAPLRRVGAIRGSGASLTPRHLHLMKRRLAAAAHGSTDTASDGTSQAPHPLSGSPNQTALLGESLS